MKKLLKKCCNVRLWGGVLCMCTPFCARADVIDPRDSLIFPAMIFAAIIFFFILHYSVLLAVSYCCQRKPRCAKVMRSIQVIFGGITGIACMICMMESLYVLLFLRECPEFSVKSC